MTDRERLLDLINQALLKMKPNFTFEALADYLLENGVIVPPCKVGDIVYKICPKCNKDHNGSCKHCAWAGCFTNCCDVGVRVYFDGSYNKHDLQIVPFKVTKDRYIGIIELWDVMFFKSATEAERAKNEYLEIRNIEDSEKRYKKYLLWETKRKHTYSFFGRWC